MTSTLIIAFSLIQYSNNDAANAEQFHRCGLEINEVCRRFEFGVQSAGAEETRLVAEAFNTVLQKYSINHDAADFDVYRAQKTELYNLSRAKRLMIHAGRYRRAMAPYLLLLIVLLATAVALASDWIADHLPQPAPTPSSQRQISN